jgi:hypothetical protein
MKRTKMRFAFLTIVGALLAVAGAASLAPAEDKPPAEDAAVKRARKQVQMLDDLYKTAIVLITTHYVEEDSDLPAGEAFIALFDAMKEKGWHEVRLVDATGQPIEEKNRPADAFEKSAIERLKAGKPAEEIVEKEGKRFLRIATPIPVVMEKCVMCHAHYKDAKPGEVIGSLSYTMPIE